MKKKYDWAPSITYTMFGQAVEFTGREAKLVADDKLRASLMRLGVFEELPGNRLRYAGNAEFKMPDGSMTPVDANGKVDIDLDLFDADEKVNLLNELTEE